jgi:hypothetical protein
MTRTASRMRRCIGSDIPVNQSRNPIQSISQSINHSKTTLLMRKLPRWKNLFGIVSNTVGVMFTIAPYVTVIHAQYVTLINYDSRRRTLLHFCVQLALC